MLLSVDMYELCFSVCYFVLIRTKTTKKISATLWCCLKNTITQTQHCDSIKKSWIKEAKVFFAKSTILSLFFPKIFIKYIDNLEFSKEVVYNCKGSRMCIQDNSNTKLIIRQKNDILMVCTTTLKVDSCAMQYCSKAD